MVNQTNMVNVRIYSEWGMLHLHPSLAPIFLHPDVATATSDFHLHPFFSSQRRHSFASLLLLFHQYFSFPLLSVSTPIPKKSSSPTFSLSSRRPSRSRATVTNTIGQNRRPNISTHNRPKQGTRANTTHTRLDHHLTEPTKNPFKRESWQLGKPSKSTINQIEINRITYIGEFPLNTEKSTGKFSRKPPLFSPGKSSTKVSGIRALRRPTVDLTPGRIGSLCSVLQPHGFTHGD
jgi:hypothetical protein